MNPQVDPKICAGCPGWNASRQYCIAIAALLRCYGVKTENKDGVSLYDRPGDCLRAEAFKIKESGG